MPPLGLLHVKSHDCHRFVESEFVRNDICEAQKARGHKSIETTAYRHVLDKLEPGLMEEYF